MLDRAGLKAATEVVVGGWRWCEVHPPLPWRERPGVLEYGSAATGGRWAELAAAAAEVLAERDGELSSAAAALAGAPPLLEMLAVLRSESFPDDLRQDKLPGWTAYRQEVHAGVLAQRPELAQDDRLSNALDRVGRLDKTLKAAYTVASRRTASWERRTVQGVRASARAISGAYYADLLARVRQAPPAEVTNPAERRAQLAEARGAVAARLAVGSPPDQECHDLRALGEAVLEGPLAADLASVIAGRTETGTEELLDVSSLAREALHAVAAGALVGTLAAGGPALAVLHRLRRDTDLPTVRPPRKVGLDALATASGLVQVDGVVGELVQGHGLTLLGAPTTVVSLPRDLRGAGLAPGTAVRLVGEASDAHLRVAAVPSLPARAECLEDLLEIATRNVFAAHPFQSRVVIGWGPGSAAPVAEVAAGLWHG